MSTVAGTLLPTPYGGQVGQIMVDLDQDALNANGLSPIDISNAISNQNVTLPSGTVKIGEREYTVSTNSSPSDFSMLNDVPVKFANGAIVFMRDVAHVRDGDAVQQNVVRADGKPSVLLTTMKTGSVSTLAIVDEIKNRILPAARASAPKGMLVKELFDQSVFVRASINGVLREAVIAACLTGLMIFVVSRVVAFHTDHRGFDTALHAECAGPQDERNDFGRSAVGYRNSGGRRDGHH